MDTIRNLRNTILINFEKRGDNFTLRVPHYYKWRSIIRMLTKRGWAIGENAYYKERYESLSKFNKIGYKKGLVCLMEIKPSGIEIKIGDIKNLWHNLPQSMWDNPTDERYTHLSYLENIAVKLETLKLIDFCKKFNLTLEKEDKDLSPEDYIINKLNNNTHIHGEVICLNDITLSIKEDSYNYMHNSNDQNKKKIICGDKKYFYSSETKRLSCGIVWHNINNMWWIISGGKLYNKASFELFDFDKNLPKRQKISEYKYNSLIAYYSGKKDFLKCHKINVYNQKLKTA